MLSATELLTSGGVTVAAVALVADQAGMEAKDWTAMGILATVLVLGIGFMSKYVDRMATAIADNTKQQAEVAKQLALMVHESQAQRMETREAIRDIKDAIDDIPNKSPKRPH